MSCGCKVFAIVHHLKQLQLYCIGSLSATKPNSKQLAWLIHSEHNLIMPILVHPAVICVEAASSLCSCEGILQTQCKQIDRKYQYHGDWRKDGDAVSKY